MYNENTELTFEQDNQEMVCSMCNQKIHKDDLVHITENLTIHFKCYIEIQDKICACCGKPFLDQEILFYCEEHKEYFHRQNSCLKNHLQKHMPFKKVRYDASRNRITSFEHEREV